MQSFICAFPPLSPRGDGGRRGSVRSWKAFRHCDDDVRARCRESGSGGGREGGAILIIAIGVLTLLAILGATFAHLMRLEKQATKNYLDSQEVDLITDSALEAVIAQLRGADNWFSFTQYRAPWLYKLLKVDDLAHGLEPLDSDNVKDWEVLSEKQKQRYRYKVKVIDTSAQININGK